MSVPRSALHSKVRKAVPDQRQSASYRFMPELRPVETTGIPLYGHPAWLLLRHIPPSVRSFSFRADGVVGKRWHILLVPSVVPPACHRQKESPFCLPGRPFLLPAQAVIHHFYKHPLIYTGQFCLLYLYRDYLLSSYLACRRVGFIRCECRLSHLILPFWSAFWRKIFLAGQEYFASKKRRMGCTDILVMHHKTPRRSGRKDPTRGKKKTKSQVMAGLTTLPQNIFKLCYTFTLSVASERIVRLSRVHTVRLLLLTWQ